MNRYVPTRPSFPALAPVAAAQGLTLRHVWHRGVYRWVLSRTDWSDHKQYLVYPLLRDVAGALKTEKDGE